MNYSISDAYKDVEQILKRPLNSFDFNTINALIQNYDIKYVQWCLTILKNHNVFSTNYIKTFMFNNLQTYQVSKEMFATSITPTQDAQQETKTDDNMCNEVGWEGCSKDEQAYLIAMFKHSLYPDEFPEPTRKEGL